MAYPQFSETQFVVSFLREYLNLFPFFPDPFFLFHSIRIPSTVEERETGADFIFRHFSHSEFFQFKRSHKIHYRGRSWLNEPEKSLPRTFFDYYRFEIYNSDSQQFEKLRDISVLNPNDKSYYVAPLFYSSTSFNNYFHRQVILNNSVLIPCSQFRDARFNPPNFNINDGNRHFILYNRNFQGLLLSEPKEIKVLKPSKEQNEFYKSETGYQQIRKILDWCRKDSIEKYGNDNFKNEYLTISDGIGYLSNQYNIIWQPIFRLK